MLHLIVHFLSQLDAATVAVAWACLVFIGGLFA